MRHLSGSASAAALDTCWDPSRHGTPVGICRRNKYILIFCPTLEKIFPSFSLQVGAMAFFRKAGNVLGRAMNSHISQEIPSSSPSIFQAIRCMSSSKLFIGGLSFNTDDRSLKQAFNEYGEVSEARVIMDRETGRSRGFGFVTYSSIDEATAAIQALNEQELDGRRIRVDYANDRVRGYGGGGGFGGSYGGSNPREEY
ncbi:glycine-rich RNA-binding protein 3 [Perilla frutescens var. hirtella]|uniref:Glycine-rich RNA-binding protein 3 n=1 Tax=Perilla frutescens var. hirtella TaxID=608512 RepID=A0AAD4NYR7_PERFH|nr:glycine-rich RNA-binding protein 3 [Perilla frutescens var. hirtella]